MKSNLLKSILLVAVTALLTYFVTCYFGLCSKDPIDTGGTRNATTICVDYDSIAPPTLTTNMIKSMVSQYQGAQLNSIQTASTNAVAVDAQSIWFDLETLKQFLYQVEQKTGKNFTESKDKKLGIRIYYAAYPDNNTMRTLASTQTDPNFSYNPAYEKLHTLVMIPTISGYDGKNYDYNPLDVATYDGFVNVKKSASNFSLNSNTYTTLSLGTSTDNTAINVQNSANIARNHGALTPPDTILGLSF